MAMFIRFIIKKLNNSLLARSSNNIYKNETELDKEIEIEVLRNLDHPHIIKLEEIIYEEKTGRLYIVMEQGKKNIAEIIEDKKKIGADFDEDTIRIYMTQLIEAVGHMHDVGYFHRDLKPENMMLVDDSEIRLIDFGTCMKWSEIKDKTPFSDYVSTRWYRAPECILKFAKYNEKVDVFAIGWIMAEMYRMAPAFWGKNALDQLRIYWYALGSPKKHEWPEAYKKAEALGFEIPQLPKRSIGFKVDLASEDAIDLMDQMLNLNPKDRPDIKTILGHPYFSKPEETFNPFVSPVVPPKTNESFANNYFTEPTFGGEMVPNFAHIVNDDSPNKAMDICYSPAKNSDFSGMSTGSQKKARSELNDEPWEPKFSYSQGKDTKYKKAKSTHEDDNPSSFGGFNIEDFKEQKERSKSHVPPMDDEVTNTDTAFDIFWDKNRKATEEDLPSFGSLVNDETQSINRRKSHYAPEIGRLGSNMKNVNAEDEFQIKSKNDLSIKNSYQNYKEPQQDAPGFGAFGMISYNNNINANVKPSSKPKKQSIWDDDELLFAVANPNPN
jgi:serine/threonine protein kinase